MSLGERLRIARKNKGFTQQNVAKHFNITAAAVSSWEKNRTEPSLEIIKKLANLLDVDTQTLQFGESPETWEDNFPKSPRPTVPLVGNVGAGGHIHPIDDHLQGAGLEDIEAPFGAPKGTLAVMVTGESMYPYLKTGSILYYTKRLKNVQDYLHELVIVHFADGRKAVKTVTLGSVPGTFTLTSMNAPPIIDVQVESVSPIDWMKPA